jgi:hypothetical protein
MLSRRENKPRMRRLAFEALEERRVLAAGFAEFFDPHPAAGNRFGETIVPLATGNVVVTSPYDDAGGTDAGAVYLFNGRTGALISTLTGSHANDHVGGLNVFNYPGITALTNGNFVVTSYEWDSAAAANAGAVTFGNGITGISGVVSAANSLVGSRTGDQVGSFGVTALTNGNYVVMSPNWDAGIIGTIAKAGAVTFGSGVSGISGPVSSGNSLVGSTANDQIGYDGVVALTNGNYVVRNPFWSNGTAANAGALTFGNGTTGISGAVSVANSLVGSSPGDAVGGPYADGVAALANGNYVVASVSWDNGTTVDVGAITWGNGTNGVTGVVSAANSLIGSTSHDQLGNFGVKALANGNYVVSSPSWDKGAIVDAGAVTFGNGTSAMTGVVSEANSLVGSTVGDQVGSYRVAELSNGKYVVPNPQWDNGAMANVGAVTLASGTTGISGTISAANSLIGSTAEDTIGDSGFAGQNGVTALTNGNYVVISPHWSNGAAKNAGAATFANGSTGITGTVSATNSLVGSTADDSVGETAVALANGNYVVSSPFWNNSGITDVGAVTFGSGTTGVKGVVSAANSLIGTTQNDDVSFGDIVALTNGNYVVATTAWNNGAVPDVGAATFGNGTSGVKGAVSAANSLIGSTATDEVGFRITGLSTGNYVLETKYWNSGALVDAGAVTFGNGTTGVTDTLTPANSIFGNIANSDLRPVVVDDVNKTFFCPFFAEGRVRVGSQVDGFAHPWHFAAKPRDVNNDTHVAANDAVAIVNYINARLAPAVAPGASIGQPFGFLDVNGDDFVAANDALDVINAINAGMGGEGEPAEGRIQNAEGRIQSGGVDQALIMFLAMDGNAPAARRRGY